MVESLAQKLKQLVGKNLLFILIPFSVGILFFFLYMGQLNLNRELDRQLLASKEDYSLLQEQYSNLEGDYATYKEENQDYIKEGKVLVEKREELLQEAEEAVGILEEKVSRQDLEGAKRAVEKLTDENQKTAFTSRITAVENKIVEKEREAAEEKLLSEIEEAVKKMESDQTKENSQAAADKLTQLSSGDKKTRYQERIDAVNHAIAVKEAEAQQQVQQFAQTPEPAQTVYYANCSAVHAAGASPIRRGEPGYSRKLDRDGDGVACER